MRRTRTDAPRRGGLALALVLTACAAGPKRGSEPATAPAAARDTADETGAVSSPEAPPQAMPPPPPASASVHAESTTIPQAPAGSTYATAPGRGAAMTQASRDLEASQRELDVAGGDCRNACRALGSMDRAAGRLCGLAQSPEETRRCGDAKGKVLGARDRVRNTCGSCAEVSVERDAPIPSR